MHALKSCHGDSANLLLTSTCRAQHPQLFDFGITEVHIRFTKPKERTTDS